MPPDPCSSNSVGHHLVPREILNKYLDRDVAENPLVRGSQGNPNILCIPESLHKEIHKGPGGGRYNEDWKKAIRDVLRHKPRVEVEDVLRIKEDMIKRYGLDMFAP